MDLSTLTTAQLLALYSRVQAEITSRRMLADAAGQAGEIEARASKDMSEVTRAFLQARDRATPTGQSPPWVKPTKRFNAYWPGYPVAHAGKVWESLTDANTTEPGSDPQTWQAVTS